MNGRFPHARPLAAAALSVVALLGAAACSKKEGTAAQTVVRPPVAVELVKAEAADLPREVEVVGTLVPRFDAEVKSDFAGRVSEVYATQWVRVRKGAPLARVDTEEGEVALRRAGSAVEMAKANLLEAKAAAGRAERELERARALKAAGLLTQQSLDDATTQKEAADAREAAALAAVGAAEEDVRQARTRLGKAVVRAPFDGVVAERFVDVGEVVGDMQKVLFRIVDDRRLNLTLTIPSADLAEVREGQPVTFEVDSIPGRVFTARLRYINPVVDEVDRSVKAVAEVDGAGGALKGGLFANARISTGQRRGVLRVPRGALLSWDTGAAQGELFVVAGGVARKRAVRTGTVAGDRIEIVSGLSPGEDVVHRGAFNVKDGDRVAPAAAKHAPQAAAPAAAAAR